METSSIAFDYDVTFFTGNDGDMQILYKNHKNQVLFEHNFSTKLYISNCRSIYQATTNSNC